MEMLTTIFNELATFLITNSPIILNKIIFLLILFFSYKPVKRILGKGFERFLKSKSIDNLLVDFLESLLNLFIFIFYLLNFVNILGIEMASILAIIGSIGIGVGLALKGSLSDLAGGIQILFSKNFTKGDYIAACGVDGVVDKITFLYTVLSTLDNKLVVIPNGKLSTDVIVNYGYHNERRVDLVFSVSYDTSIEKTKEILNNIIANHSLILKNKDAFVRLGKHNSSSLDFTVRVWSLTEHYWDVYFDLQELVKNRFDEEGIEIPYQKIDIYNK